MLYCVKHFHHYDLLDNISSRHVVYGLTIPPFDGKYNELSICTEENFSYYNDRLTLNDKEIYNILYYSYKQNMWKFDDVKLINF